MSLLFAMFGAVLSGLCCFAASRKWPQKRTVRHLFIICIVGVSLLGAVCGWMLPRYAQVWTNYIRFLVLMMALSAATYTDMDDHRIPNACPLAILCGFVLVTVLDFVVIPDLALSVLTGGILGGVAILLILLLFRFLSRGGIGYGDIKLMAAMGTLIGISGTISVLLIAQIAALMAAGVLLIMKKVTVKDSLPFAPFFYLGFLGSLCLGTF